MQRVVLAISMLSVNKESSNGLNLVSGEGTESVRSAYRLGIEMKRQVGRLIAEIYN